MDNSSCSQVSSVDIREKNAILNDPDWKFYTIFRLSHWGLTTINGKRVSTYCRGGCLSKGLIFNSRASCFQYSRMHEEMFHEHLVPLLGEGSWPSGHCGQASSIWFLSIAYIYDE